MTGKVDITGPHLPLAVPAGKTGHLTGSASRKQGSFQALLEQAISKSSLKFSQHARERLAARQIQLTPGEVERLNQAVERAAQKGARDTLVLMDNLALVVSVANRTVVTAVDGKSMKEHVFTNIDSAVIA